MGGKYHPLNGRFMIMVVFRKVLDITWGFSQNHFFEQVKYHKWTVMVNGSTQKNKITNKTGGSMIYFCV